MVGPRCDKPPALDPCGAVQLHHEEVARGGTVAGGAWARAPDHPHNYHMARPIYRHGIDRIAIGRGSRAGEVRIVDGIPVIPARGALVTKELIDRLIEEEDLEAIKFAAGKK